MGDIHMVLAQVALRDEAYRKFYKGQRKYKILDNGLFEEGVGLKGKDLVEAAIAIGADEVILTDVLFKGKETTYATIEAYEQFVVRGKQDQFAFMAVPQGESIEEWVSSYATLSCLPWLKTIGLSKLSIPHCWDQPIAEARCECLSHLLNEDLFARNKNHHLLGGSNHVLQELRYYNQTEIGLHVSSIDTSAPYFYGVSKLRLTDDLEEIKTQLNFSAAKCDFDREMIVASNIAALLEEAHVYH
jgi:hypothetical protein